jgi:hypothetical protein
MSKLHKLIREVRNELLQEGLLRGQVEMSQSEFGDFIKSYKSHVDSNSQYNGVLTLGKENWDGDDSQEMTYVGYVEKSNIHFRFFPNQNDFYHDTEILPKPFMFVHQSDFKSSGKVKED